MHAHPHPRVDLLRVDLLSSLPPTPTTTHARASHTQVNLDAVNVAATIYVQGRHMPHPALAMSSLRHDPRESRKYVSENAKKVPWLAAAAPPPPSTLNPETAPEP